MRRQIRLREVFLLLNQVHEDTLLEHKRPYDLLKQKEVRKFVNSSKFTVLLKLGLKSIKLSV